MRFFARAHFFTNRVRRQHADTSPFIVLSVQAADNSQWHRFLPEAYLNQIGHCFSLNKVRVCLLQKILVRISGKICFSIALFYSGSFCLHLSHCRDVFGELLKTRVLSKGDWVSERSSEVRSVSDIYFWCNGCLNLEDDFLTQQNRVFAILRSLMPNQSYFNPRSAASQVHSYPPSP